ncbi:MAG TPA: hypothetical protein VK465_07470, partial [Fibrobacteria bacterium]|nr:hypothetical protein [Fibrobacteria bacterium]
MPPPSHEARQPSVTSGPALPRRLAACLTLALAGCIFDDQGFTPEPRYAAEQLDTLLPASAVPARIVHLYQPLRDPSLAGKPSAAPEALPPVNLWSHAD